MSGPTLPARIVHLQGGLRAVDDRSGTTFVQVDESIRYLSFSSPEYPQLYGTLRGLGLEVIGVEFLTSGGTVVAPDWWVASPLTGFRLEPERRAWCDVRHQGINDQRHDIVDASRRFTALIELLAIRLLQMSRAYNNAFRSQLSANAGSPLFMFDNTFVPHLEASIHAFLGDAANLRDFLSEFVWKYVLRQSDGVTSFKTFRSRAARFDDPIAQSMIQEGQSGWIKRLSNLRNNAFHVAPIGANHIFPSCYGRTIKLPRGDEITCVGYGLLERSLDLQGRVQSAIAAHDEEAIKRDMQDYSRQLERSDDALRYAWVTLAKFCSLAEEARVASGLQGKMLHLTDDDILDVEEIS
jgi:hypothetical protein